MSIPSTNRDGISGLVAEALQSDDEPWWPGLARALAECRLAELQAEGHLLYSTSTLLGHQPEALLSLQVGSDMLGLTNNLELLAKPVRTRFEAKGLSFLDLSGLRKPRLVALILEAVKAVGALPGLHETVLQLAKSMHVLEPRSDELDTSFSDPNIPFSVFFSMPLRETSNEVLRVAESIIHEAMHLQLSLVERHVPLSPGRTTKYLSPWKETDRETSGIMHGLYVFGVIDAWLTRLPMADQKYVYTRRTEIRAEVLKVRDVVESPDLSSCGRRLCRELIDGFQSH